MFPVFIRYGVEKESRHIRTQNTFKKKKKRSYLTSKKADTSTSLYKSVIGDTIQDIVTKVELKKIPTNNTIQTNSVTV